MHSPLYRLRRMRLALIGVLVMMSGVVLVVVAAGRPDFLSDFARSLCADIGIGLLVAGLVSLLVDFRSKREADEHRDEGIRKVFDESAPALRDSVIEGFAASPEVLSKVVSAETLDHVVRNSLTARLGDHDLATEVYDDLQAQVIGARNCCYHAKCSVALSPWAKGPRHGGNAMFVATIRWEYQVDPLPATLRFTCVDNEAEYRTMLRDQASTTTWLFRPAAGLTAAAEDAFEVLQVAVDGKEQRIRRTTRAHSQSFLVALDERAQGTRKRATVSYTFRTLVRREGRFLNLDIAQPTKGLHIQLFYGGCDIGDIKILDHIASAQQPQITQVNGKTLSPSVSIGFDGWVWPKGGVAFVWPTLDR